MLTAKKTLLPCGVVINWDSPVSEKRKLIFSSLTMDGIPFFTTKYLFYACLLKWTSTVPLLVSVGNYYVGHLKI